MKNRKGFTIIELLVTIALISAVSIVVGVNVLSMNERQKAKDIEQFQKKLEDAACTYADVMGITEPTSISTYCLIKDGYLKKMPVPGTNNTLGENDYNVMIDVTFVSNEKKCTYTSVEGNSCPEPAAISPESDSEPDPDPDDHPGIDETINPTPDPVIIPENETGGIAIFDAGEAVNVKIKKLTNSGTVTSKTKDTVIKAIARSSTLKSGFVPSNSNTISSSSSQKPIYIWYDSGSKKVYYYSEANELYFNVDSGKLFSGFTSVLSIDINGIKTTGVEDMRAMFMDCYSLTSIDVTNFDTSKVRYMHMMFAGCKSLTSINVSSFQTSKVGYMDYMFADCEKLQSIDIRHFDTTTLSDCYYMFSGCTNLKTLLIGNVTLHERFDMNSSAFDMSGMFQNCSSLTELDLSGFNTSNVEDMTDMFSGCSSLKTIKVSTNFSTQSITSSSTDHSAGMFSGCTSLVGGNGTKYNSNYTNKQYARIDKSGTKGYFTKAS